MRHAPSASNLLKASRHFSISSGGMGAMVTPPLAAARPPPAAAARAPPALGASQSLPGKSLVIAKAACGAQGAFPPAAGRSSRGEGAREERVPHTAHTGY